ncbi:MAG: hypothetical protein IPJ76_18920 [Flavobacteriales bacterium]|nr:MAG: hypothetical protein IPJ76_18920 [Flavobacteriales bacterium]
MAPTWPGCSALPDNNGIGYAGVDWNCKLMITQVLNSSNSATSANMTAAFYYAVDNGADVSEHVDRR